jgi:hypothetical protein
LKQGVSGRLSAGPALEIRLVAKHLLAMFRFKIEINKDIVNSIFPKNNASGYVQPLASCIEGDWSQHFLGAAYNNRLPGTT